MKKQGMVDEERLFKPPIEHQNHGAKPFILFKSPIFNENRKNIRILEGVPGVSNQYICTNVKELIKNI